MTMVYTSRFPLPSLPRSSIFHYLFPSSPESSVYPVPARDTIAFIDGLSGRSVTRDQVRTQALQVGGGLNRLGLCRGDVAALFGTNSLEWVNAIFGAQAAGLRVSPVNYAYTPPELLHQLRHSGAVLIFISPHLLPVLEQAFKLAPSSRDTAYSLPSERIILLCPPSAKPTGASYKTIEELWSVPHPGERFENGAENETVYLCYSSGTTGVAKGVETTHYNMTSQLQALTPAYQQLKPGRDVVLGYLPFSHMYGLALLVHHPLVVGVPVVVLPRFEETSVLKAIERYKVTWALVVPPVLIILLHSPNLGKYNLSSLRGMMSAAAPLSESLCRGVEKRFPGCYVTQGYGLTETTPMITMMTTDEAGGRQSSVGRLMPTWEARVVDPMTGIDVSRGEPGEFWVRGPSVMKGYLKNPTATDGTFAPGRWFKTGDLTVIDNDGYITIVDRLKELIKYKGFQVAPADLEATLLTHPQVADAAVIGVYVEEQATELPRAYVVPKGGLQALRTPEDRRKFSTDVIKWLDGRVANHKRLRGGCIPVEAIPKTPTGKILRKNLRAMVQSEMMEAKVRAKL